MTLQQNWNVNTNLLALIFLTIRNVKTWNRTKTGYGTNRKIWWMNLYVYTNSPALKFFRFDHQKCKNRKPDKKPDPGQTGKLYRWIFMSIQIHLHWIYFDLTIRSTKTGNRTLVREIFFPQKLRNSLISLMAQ